MLILDIASSILHSSYFPESKEVIFAAKTLLFVISHVQPIC